MRVLAPIKVSIFALLGFRLNIDVPLGLIGAVHLGLDRYTLCLPDERLAKTVTHVPPAVDLDVDSRGLEALRQSNGLVVVLEVAERVGQADAAVGRDLR